MSSAEILSRMLSVNLAQLVETLLKLLPKLIVYGRKKGDDLFCYFIYLSRQGFEALTYFSLKIGFSI